MKKLSYEYASVYASILLTILATFLLVKGIRDVDAGLNLCIVKMETGIEFRDKVIFSEKMYSMTELYELGIFEIFISLILFLWAVAILWSNFFKRWREIHERRS